MSAVLDRGLPRVRCMRADDLDAVHAIERRAYTHPWSMGILRDCLKAGYGCYVFEDGEALLGYGIMSMAAGEGHVLNLCVDPAFQGQGVGRRILVHLLDQARRRDVDTLFLEVRESNAPAIALYHALGFNEIGRRRDYYPAPQGREDALLFARSL